MTTQIKCKLSKSQADVVRKMREGHMLGIQKYAAWFAGGVSINLKTANKLLSLGLLQENPDNGFHELTTLGRDIKLDEK